MAATRIIPYIMAILKNNPHLATHFMQLESIANEFGEFLTERIGALNPQNVPEIVGIDWYKEDSYQRCRQLFDDGADLPESFDEWLRSAERVENQVKDQGMKVVRVEINPDTFPVWCSEHGFVRIDKHARMAYGNARAFETVMPFS